MSSLADGERRLDGETYLTSGYGTRLQITSSTRYSPMSDIADIWQPSRLKGIGVAADHGMPFLTATQVFDIRPTPRKWLAPSRTPKLDQRLVERDWILVTCSGTVGDAIVSYGPQLGTIISHDLLRVQPKNAQQLGYLYSFIRGRYGRAMLRSSHYGSIVKHLEPEHLSDIPVPIVDQNFENELNRRVREAFRLRDEAFDATKRAESIFERALGGAAPVSEPLAFSASAGEMFPARRRLEAYFFNPVAESALQAIKTHAAEVASLADVTDSVFGVARFKHVYQDDGIPYIDSEDLFKISPEVTKFIPQGAKRNAAAYFVKRGWLLMACSGQRYGLNGSVVLAGPTHENKIVSNHVLRIVPRGNGDDVRPGFLQMALGHPSLGRPLVLRLAFGSEVPEISPDDLLDHFPVARLDRSTETEIADLVEQSAVLRSRADDVEEKSVRAVEDRIHMDMHRPS